jgi:outer membrane protein OmpA-like peptidoglycan-associated protein
MQKFFLSLAFFVCSFTGAMAQYESYTAEQQQVVPELDFFVPHWFVNLQAGGSYHVGEAKFQDLLSPHLQLGLGYQFNPIWAGRLSLSGWEARNKYAYPSAKYKWNYIQPSLEAMLNLTNLFAGWDYERTFNAYAFAGLGLAYSFNNDDAEKADQWMRDNYNQRMSQFHVERQVTEFQKLWRDNRWNPVVKAGLGADVRVTDNVAIGAEVNANMLPDHWNSKKGKNDNRDWQFNAMLGVKVTLGKTHGQIDAAPEPVRQMTQPTDAFTYIDMPIEQISFNVNIYFIINTSYIRDNQVPKLTALINYLREHPKSYVRLSGFADKETGNPTINMRLSIERSTNVSRYLQDQGISEQRIRRFAKGDTVQPFDIPEENRVCICYVYDPDNPDPRAFEW